MLEQVVLSYSSKVCTAKPLVQVMTGYGSIAGTLTSILSLGRERRLTAKTKG